MKNRRQSLVVRRLFACVLMLSFLGVGFLSAQQDQQNQQNQQDQNQTGNQNQNRTGRNQNQNQTDGNQNQVGGNQTNDRPGGGVFINANGVLTRHAALDFDRVAPRKINAARASHVLPGDVSAKSPMRCVSLNRLEKSLIAAAGIPTEEMACLAGIQRITHVFYFPESKDIVIAGPAEGWFPGYEGAMVGKTTSLPVCELQDLVVALRAYPPGENSAGQIIGCSIDPTAEGINQLQQFTTRFRGGLNNRQAFVNGIRQAVGMQTIRVDGIPGTTNAARMMVAADYRMKLIGLGIDSKPIRRMDTFIDHTVPNASDKLFRWYFTPDYDSVLLTEDHTGMELVGSGVKLVAENEIIGEGTPAVGELDPGSKAYTRSFTQHYSQIAGKALVFAQLRNWIDMLICAAHIQREDFYGKAGWSMEFFASEEKYSLERFTVPQEVEPVVGGRAVGLVYVAPVGGGVVIDAARALDEAKKNDKIADVQKGVALNLPDGVWWWDVKL